MKSLFSLFRHAGLDLNGSRLRRKAVRAIIYQDGHLLMIKSEKYGEVKFPGGGVHSEETPFQSLAREVKEETGYTIKPEITPFGSTCEYARDFEGKYHIFQQESDYYICDIYEHQESLNLDDYEIEYGYHPLFIKIETAIQINDRIPPNDQIPWKERDTRVLKLLLAVKEGNL